MMNLHWNKSLIIMSLKIIASAQTNCRGSKWSDYFTFNNFVYRFFSLQQYAPKQEKVWWQSCLYFSCQRCALLWVFASIKTCKLIFNLHVWMTIFPGKLCSTVLLFFMWWAVIFKWTILYWMYMGFQYACNLYTHLENSPKRARTLIG